MTNFLALNIQSTLELIVFALVSKWYIAPRLATKDLYDALIPLLFIHALRFLPVTLLVKGQVSSEIPQYVSNEIAYGDLVSSILAIVSILFLKFRISGAIATAWIFNIFGALDIINAFRVGIGAKLYDYPLGFNWYILNFYTPLLIVSHFMIFSMLIKKPLHNN